MSRIKGGFAKNGNEVILWRDVDGHFMVTTRLPGDPYRREYCNSDDFHKANRDYNDLLR